MRTVHDMISGDVEIVDELRLHGMITGTATVRAGGRLQLHGMVMGDLNVDDGGVVLAYGMVCGRLTNRGGQVDLYGTVGSLVDEGGRTTVYPGAVADGRAR